jgi:LPS export ABC transporter protein LptC
MGVDAQEMEDAMKLRVILISTAAILLIGIFLRGDISKKQAIEDNSSSSSDNAPLTEQIRSFSISGFSESGKKAWEAQGKTANIFADVINLADVNADSYSQEVKVNLKADEGVFDRKTNSLQLKKNVVVVTDEGTNLTTDSLSWDADQEKVFTEDHVFIERKDMDIEGTGASAKPDLKIAKLENDVVVKPKDPPAIITCDGPLEVDYANNIAYFYNNVKLDDTKTKIDTDKAIAYFDPKSRSLTKVFCQGNVKIVRGEDITYAQELTYLPQEGRVLLTGKPKIVISSSEDLLKKTKEPEDEPVKDRKSD